MAKSQIIDQLVILAEAFGLSVTDARMEIYADMLSDLPIEKLRAGIVHIIKTRTFAGNLPTVAEIREAVIGDGQPIETRAALAWDTALSAIHDHGPYQSPSFTDHIITRIVIAWGGWADFGLWPAEETKWKRKEFMQLYAAYAADTHPPEVPDHLIGISEGVNRDHFPEFVPQPVRIGEKPKEGQKRLSEC
jgi:hypothetical protein